MTEISGTHGYVTLKKNDTRTKKHALFSMSVSRQGIDI